MPERLEEGQVLSFSNYVQVLLGRVAFREISGASVCAQISAAIPPVVSVDALGALRQTLLRIVCGLERSAARTNLAASALAIHVSSILTATSETDLQHAFESYGQSWIAPPAGRVQKDRRITEAQELVLRRFSDPSLCIDEVASAVRLSRWHFERLFHRVAGDCFRRYVRRVRLDAAMRLLEHSTLSIKEISAAVGYAQPGSFNRQFRQTVQLTPTQWRRAVIARRPELHGRADLKPPGWQ